MAENQVLMITFDQLAWASHQELSGGGDPPRNHLPSLTPYIWIVFFKIDGTTVILNDAGTLVSPDGSPPQGLVFSAPGSHGDVGPKMTVGDARGIPATIGSWTQGLTPIAVPPNLVGAVGQSNFPATFGAALVLNRSGGHIPEHAIEAGHQELVAAVGTVLTQLLQTLGPGNETITSEQIAVATAGLSSGVTDAVENAMSFWEKLWAVSGEDSSIGQVILTWSQDDLAKVGGSIVSQDLGVIVHGGEAVDIWTVGGSVACFDPCPAGAIEAIFGLFLKPDEPPPQPNRMTLSQMRRLRDAGLFDSLPGLNAWWEQWQRATPDVVSLMRDKPEFRQEIEAILSAAGESLQNIDAVIDPGLLKHITNALEIAGEKGSSGVSASAVRAHDVIAALDNPSSRVLLQSLSNDRPVP